MAKASVWNSSDGEGRRLGERLGLDIVSCYKILCQISISLLNTPVVLAVNNAHLVLQSSWEIVVPERRC